VPPFNLHPLLAFGLVNLPMLGWLAAAAAPILIHLWSRRKYREMSWAAMEYLLAAVHRQTRRLLFEQWILLAIRTLLVVLIVLAVAEPYLERTGMAFTPGEHTHRVLVIDGSYSMAYKPTDKSRFDRAKELARQIVEESPEGDAFTLVLMSSPPRVIVGTPALEPSEIVQEIDGLRLPHTTADLPATVALVLPLVRNVQRENPRLARHEVCFLTDLQRLTWAPQLSEAAMSEFLRQSGELAQAAALHVIDLGQPAAENLAVTGLRTLDPLVAVGRGVPLEADLKNFGRQARSRQPVELLVDGRRIEQKQIDVPADGECSVDFSYRFEAPGDHAIEVRAPGDALEVDNRRFLVVPVRESLRVLCIDGRPSGTPFRGAADYLAVALAPQGTDADRALVRTETATESALLERSLSGYDCLFLCNVAQFTAGEARVLDTYLKGGGSLVFFLGNQVLADRYNRELGGGAGQGGAAGPNLLPARLGSVADRPQFRLDPLDYRHPIVQAFRGRGQAGLLTTPVLKHFKLDLPKDSPAMIVLAMANGDPLIVEQPMHRGRVVLVATSADASWTAMPLWPSFVPLVQEIVAWCAGGQLQQQNIMVGEPLDAAIATQSGIFTVRSGPPLGRNRVYAINVDTAESDLSQVDLDELRSDVWPGVPFTHHTSWQDAGGPAVGGPARAGAYLPINILYLVLGLLFLETLLGWRFGYHG
jgi:hypothetical protein